MNEEEKRLRKNTRQRAYYKKTNGKCWKKWYKKNKKRHFENINNYRNTPKGKAYVKNYNALPKVKKRCKKWFVAHPHYRRDWMRKHKQDSKKQNGN